jgi:hypothetical protein
MTRLAGARWAGQPWAGAALAGAATGAPDGVTTTLALPHASVYQAGTSIPDYWAARSGLAIFNYVGAYLVLGTTDYVWFTSNGSGHDPGLSVAALAGMTGHVVDFDAGNVDEEDAAAATALVIDAIAGWACTNDAANIIATGPAAITVGATWDDADAGAMVGMRCCRVDEASYGEGGVSNVIAQHLPDPGIAQPVIAVDVLLGGTVNASDRFRVGFYEAAGAVSPAGEDLIIDLGQIPADQIVADSWARIHVPANVLFTADRAMWCLIKSEANVTQVGGYLSGSALRGDWTGQELRASDQGEASPMDPDATVAYSATATGTWVNSTGFVCGVRLVVASTAGAASHHSAADPAVFGVHVAPGDLGSSIDLNSNLLMVREAPPFLGMLLADAGFAVGAARGTQPRLGVLTGGDVTDPSLPDPDGATLLVDGGQLTGVSTAAWENRSLAATPWPAGAVTSWICKCNDDTTGTQIAFAQAPSTANADDPESPMDWAPVSGADGSEYEIFPADSAYNVTNPAVTFVSPFVADPDDARPGNVPGARLRFYIPGITVVTP